MTPGPRTMMSPSSPGVGGRRWGPATSVRLPVARPDEPIVRLPGGSGFDRSCGLVVPDELSVIGISDFNGAGEMKPGLTTIQNPVRDIREIAGARSAAAITGPTEGATEWHFRIRRLLECIRRGTTGAVR